MPFLAGLTRLPPQAWMRRPANRSGDLALVTYVRGLAAAPLRAAAFLRLEASE